MTMLAEGAAAPCTLCNDRARVESGNRPDRVYVVFIHFRVRDDRGLLIKNACRVKVPNGSPELAKILPLFDSEQSGPLSLKPGVRGSKPGTSALFPL